MINKYKPIIVLIIILGSIFPILPYSPPNDEKPSVETYKFIEHPQRQNVIKFLRTGLYVSSHCVFKKGSKFFRRDCGAWKPMDVLENGKYKAYFKPNKVLPDPRNPRLVSIFICVQAGGTIATEVNEFGKFGRPASPMDFCQFEDQSLLGLVSIERYLSDLAAIKKQSGSSK
ncbi:MAG: hypothetical protein H7A24_12250 [Leptospiraceae bacterium]|nr:hypothetical protein [Leptospiraceae bacterium]